MANAVIQQAGTLAPTTLGSATVNATDAAPTTDADGVSCSGYSAVGVSLAAPSAGATCTLRPWVYLGGQWARVRDSAGALVEFSVGADETFSYVFTVPTVERFLLQVSTLAAAATYTRAYAVAGPGV